MINKYYVIITGKNTNYFFNLLINKSINFTLINISNKEIYLVVDDLNYKKLKKIKTSYNIKLKKVIGPNGIIDFCKTKYYYLICVLLFIFINIFLSNICFNIKIDNNNNKLKKILLNELDNYNIKKYCLMPNYNKVEEIEKNILNKHKDIIEWLEISRIGTKYLVKVEERKINNKVDNNSYRHIVAKKDATIISINASNGEVVKKVNDYVKKGDILISGIIYNKEDVKSLVRAKGMVYGEVWYKVSVTVPFHYYEERETGKNKNNIIMKILSNSYRISFNNYKDNFTNYIFNIKNNLLPFDIGLARDFELNITDKTYSREDALIKAHELVNEKIKKINPEASIISQKELKIDEDKSKIIVDIFVRVKEDITDFLEIDQNSINEE